MNSAVDKNINTFTPLNVSSKFAICGLPIRMDTYKYCTFGCEYCFANNREIMKFSHNIQVSNNIWLEKKLHNIFTLNKVNNSNLLDMLIAQNIDFHCGGMSDPFQPCEKELNVTKEAIDICNKYNRHILFSTKSDTIYNCDIRPNLHTFQLSITNVDDRKDIEPYAPPIKNRINFFNNLKSMGFKVGIRIQPFIPNVTSLDIIKTFKNADNFTLEGIKIVPQNKEHKEYILSQLGLNTQDFKQMGLLNLKPELRLEMYKPFIEYFEKNNIPFSIADNDLHYLGTNKCCCGDNLIHKSTTFNNTYMLKTYGINYSIQDVLNELSNSNIKNCICNGLFTSNRQEGCKTVCDFYNKRFDRKTSPFSPKFLYYSENIE